MPAVLHEKGAGEAACPEQESVATDAALIRACLSGNRDSFARLVVRYERAAAGILWHFTRDPLVLEELVQDTFVEVWLSLRRFRKDAPFMPWLRTIATRVGYRYWRRLRRERDRAVLLDNWRRTQGEATASLEDGTTAEYLFQLLELLDPKDRVVLTLQYFEGCSTKEIAERMGWTTALVKVRAFRARKKLRALLLQRGHTDHEDV